MDFKILGPLEVWDGARALPIRGRKQRVVVALLLLRANEAVSRDTLTEALWGQGRPKDAAHALDVQISRLRKAVGRDRLRTHASGYSLHLEPDELDLNRFERLREDASHAPPERAAALLREALALWRGPPLADLAYESCARIELARLEEVRLLAIEDRIDADLALGRHAALVPELEELASRHPVHERFRGQLMLALYRSGRQADALNVYRSGRRVLDEELGLEPSEELRKLERAILEQDPDLARPPAAPPTFGAGHSRQRLLAGGGIVLLSGIAAAVIALLLTGSESSTTVTAPPNSVAVIDLASGKPAGSVAVGVGPRAIATGNGSVWVANTTDESISRIDARTLRLVRTIPVGEYPSDLAVAGGTAWVALGGPQQVKRISPERNEAEQGIPALTPWAMRNVICQRTTTSLTADGGALWLACHRGPSPASTSDATRIDLRRLGVVEVADAMTTSAPVAVRFADVAVGLDSIWYANTAGNSVAQVDAETLQKQGDVTVGKAPVALAVGFGSLWVANLGDATVSRITPGRSDQGPTVETVRLCEEPIDVTAGRDAVWVACRASRSVVGIDPDRNSITKTFAFDNEPARIATEGQMLWVTVPGS